MHPELLEVVMAGATPFDTVQQLAGGYCVSRCLHIVADLGVADRLDNVPRTARELADDLEVHPDALSRVLRVLSAHGVFEIHGDDVCHSAASRLLRGDHPQSMRSFARMIGLPINWKIYEALGSSVRTGDPAVGTFLPGGYWSHFVAHPEDARVFNEAMEGKAHGHVAAIVAAYDFAGFATVADIGGGRGHLLRGVLDAAPHTRGILFDLPHVIEEASSAGSERLTLVAGDFFRDELPPSDAYMLMDIIHDWGDEQALAILKAIRRAAPDSAKLLLLETMISDEPGPDWAKMLDIHMLVLLGGRQRTRREYELLLEESGFALDREIDTHAGISILEAVAQPTS